MKEDKLQVHFVFYDQPYHKDALLKNIIDSDFAFGRNVVTTIRQIQNPVKHQKNIFNGLQD